MYQKIKIALCGDSGVGKTTLKRKYMGLGVSSSYLQTLGVDFSILPISLNNKYGEIIKNTLQIWDLAGQHNFKAIRSRYYQGIFSIMLVYDCTRHSTFDNLYYWVEEIKQNASRHLLSLVLLGNKSDLRNQLEISSVEGLKKAKEIAEEFKNHLDIHFFETSALTGENVDQAFQRIIEDTYNKFTISN